MTLALKPSEGCKAATLGYTQMIPKLLKTLTEQLRKKY
jgi:hypothetical protein